MRIKPSNVLFALWLGMPILGFANIDSGGGLGTVGVYVNHDSIGSPFATDAGAVAAYASHPGLIAVIYPAAPALDPTADSDADGMPDAWELAHLGSINALPSADADGDGTTNLMEFLAGTDPSNAGSVFRPSLQVEGNDLALSVQTAAGRRYRVWGSPDLKTWTALDTIAGDGNPVQFLRTTTEPRYFLKVEILLP
ncbi:MAG: hypothetical protein WCH98_12325 [Verrucomicrobiota bacterium]